jgi:hypothetical protein
MEKKICFFFASQKGGVGKTFLAMSLVEHLRDDLNKRAVLVVDADHHNKSLSRRYAQRNLAGAILPNSKQDVLSGVITFEQSIAEDRNLLLKALSIDVEFAVVDFAAAAEHDLKAIFPNDKSMDRAFKRLGFEIVVVLPFDEQTDSTLAAGSIVNLFGQNVTYVLVKNPKRSDSKEEMNRRFDEITSSLSGKSISAKGHTMHKDGLELLSKRSNLSLSDLVAFGRADDELTDALNADWIEDFLDHQSEMWSKLIDEVYQIVEERAQEEKV